MWETWIWSLGWEDLLEKGMTTQLQYSGLENSMDCIVYGAAKSWTWLSDFHSTVWSGYRWGKHRSGYYLLLSPWWEIPARIPRWRKLCRGTWSWTSWYLYLPIWSQVRFRRVIFSLRSSERSHCGSIWILIWNRSYTPSPLEPISAVSLPFRLPGLLLISTLEGP